MSKCHRSHDTRCPVCATIAHVRATCDPVPISDVPLGGTVVGLDGHRYRLEWVRRITPDALGRDIEVTLTGPSGTPLAYLMSRTSTLYREPRD